MPYKLLYAIIGILLWQPQGVAQEPPEPTASIPKVMEKLPPHLRVGSETAHQRARRSNARWVSTSTWKPGQRLRVAFYGGTPQLHKKVSQIAPEWTRHGNIHLDFGFDPKTQKFRSWSPTDTQYAAEIRISFDNDGYWSAFGTESVNPRYYGPGKPSMNLQALHTPDSFWQRVILHEFGHALGFGHEHQHPRGACDSEFRWTDDPGYQPTWKFIGPAAEDVVYTADKSGRKPGLYTSMKGIPNKWSQYYVDAQMRQIGPSSAYGRSYKIGPVDRKSIMHYQFDPDFFKLGERSPCCVPEANALSPFDIAGMRANYP